jgi:putative ABC transport system permease protein
MFTNFFKIAFRTLARNKVFSFINVFGLAAGLATCLLIILYITDELGYDKSFKDAERIYRIAYSTEQGDWSSQPAPVASAMKTDFPEVEEVTRLVKFPNMDDVLLTNDNNGNPKKFFEKNGYYADPSFFKIFSYQFTSGDAGTALKDPNSIAISNQVSEKLFGNQNPIGRALKISTPFGELLYTVRGVFNNTSVKSHLPVNFILSTNNTDAGTWIAGESSWTSNNIFHTYFKLESHSDIEAFRKKLPAFLDHHAGDELKKAGYTKTLFLQPLKDIYLHSSIGNEIAANGNIKYLYILSSIAAFILLIACINFMNLSTAKSEKRAREVGVRKVMGAAKSSLITQFLGESLIMCFISLILAIILASIFLPLFNRLTQKELQLFSNPQYFYVVLALSVITGLLAGLYPAFYLSAFKPILVLKGKLANNLSATFIRKGLVVFQFAVSACLILAAIVIWKQLHFVQQQQLGFNKEQQLVLPLHEKQLALRYNSLKDELLKNPDVKFVTSASAYPGIPNLNTMLFYAEGKPSTDFVDIHMATVENDYFSTLGINIISGRPFSKEFNADSSSIILNETAVKQLGYDPMNAVGRKIQYDWQNNHYNLNIVGVTKDFHFESLHNPIKPFGFSTTNFFANKYSYVIANLHTNNYSKTLSRIQDSWTSIYPNMPFTYSFIDQDFQHNYEKEKRTSGIVVSFTLIAIVIACLGLFGLATFSAETRTKEIGIRKVLGASEAAIVRLLSKDFLKLIVIALVIAFPLSAWAMNKWLSNFAYRIPVSWWMFAVAGGIALLIAFITISYQSIKSAFANPVTSMRTE